MTFEKGHKPANKKKIEAAEESAPQNDNNLANLTPEERAIYSRVATGDNEWQTITEESVEDFSLSEDPFKLPPPAQKLRDEKKFAFRWITRNSARLDEMRSKSVPLRWWPVNSTQPAPGVLDSFVDRNTGCIQREDQMLVFKPWWMFAKEMDYERQIADGNSGDITAKNGAPTKTGDLEYRAGKRQAGKGSPLREEVKGSDVQYSGEAEVDRESGVYTPKAGESDLVVNE